MSAELVDIRATVAKQKQVIELLQKPGKVYTLAQMKRAVDNWSWSSIPERTIECLFDADLSVNEY